MWTTATDTAGLLLHQVTCLRAETSASRWDSVGRQTAVKPVTQPSNEKSETCSEIGQGNRLIEDRPAAAHPANCASPFVSDMIMFL